MKFNGSIDRSGPGKFKVEIVMDEIDSMEQAREIGAFLHDAVENWVKSKGGSFQISNKAKILQPTH